ncbi:hypothetical protein [Candidatus Nitrosocosmicus arcticus]|uniref:Putative Co/Zn/Cd cation transporter n=1 Tax=Candidatus Nitrosocosmicus arcticus TaxID=2035267 RepID=A0A557SY13_9ARCH|nr:hypothetical protein [Candidatus Nitrosocosmicus arcticus]TVP41497.1 putative Co/Zn/Cd cation transporter [Candidatus Nitrosocosmicus arcticus]
MAFSNVLITKHVHEKFQLYTSEVLIRPKGHTIEAHVNIKLDPTLTLEDTLKITDEVKASISPEFKIKDLFVIPVTS